MLELLHRVFADRRGATRAEYGLVAALVAVAIVGTLTTLSGELQRALTDLRYEAGQDAP